MSAAPKTEQETRYQVYLDERKALVEGENASADQFDKAILTLAAGALGLSLVFLEKIAPNPSPKTINYLSISWTALVVSLIAILSSFILSQHAYRRQREILEDEIFPVAGKQVDSVNWWSIWTTRLNWLSIATFIIGATMLAVFSIANVKQKFHHPKKQHQIERKHHAKLRT